MREPRRSAPRQPANAIGTAAIERVKALLAGLPDEEREDLARFLLDLSPGGPGGSSSGGEVSLAARRATSEPPRERPATARREWVRCGKSGCACAKDAAARHGPYLYHYWWENGKTRKAYAGRA